MFKCLINYNFTPDPEWIGDDYLIFDRSDDGIDHLEAFDKSKVIRTENRGNVDYDKLTWIADNYDDLPEVFLWGKTNLFKYISEEEYEAVKDSTSFTPLLTKGHRTYSDSLGPVCYYAADIYWERNDGWYFNEMPSKYARNFHEWARMNLLPSPSYIPFAPGGNYILTRNDIRKYSPDFYRNMASYLPYCQTPAEAQCAERSYYMMWGPKVIQ